MRLFCRGQLSKKNIRCLAVRGVLLAQHVWFILPPVHMEAPIRFSKPSAPPIRGGLTRKGRGNDTPSPPLLSAMAGLWGAQRARSARTRPKAARVNEARPLYLKLLTRQTMNPNTRQTNIQRLDRQNPATRQTKICT